MPATRIEAQMPPQQVTCRPHDICRGHSIDAVAGRAGKVPDLVERRARWLLGEEAGYHVVAGAKFADMGSYGFNHASAVGHQNASVRSRNAAIGNEKIVVVQRCCMNCDTDLVRTGLARVRALGDFQAVEPTRGADYKALHNLPSLMSLE
jgi:hypothetical protein